MPHPALTTAEELLELDEPGATFELVHGELRRMSPAGYWHGEAVGILAEVLGAFTRANRLGVVLGGDCGYLLARSPDTVLAPDVSFVRMDRRGEREGTGYFVGAPDLAIEVVSPGDTFRGVSKKAGDWLDHGAALVWLVDPWSRRITVCRPGASWRTLSGNDVIEGGDVLAGFSRRVDDLLPSVD